MNLAARHPGVCREGQSYAHDALDTEETSSKERTIADLKHRGARDAANEEVPS